MKPGIKRIVILNVVLFLICFLSNNASLANNDDTMLPIVKRCEPYTS